MHIKLPHGKYSLKEGLARFVVYVRPKTRESPEPKRPRCVTRHVRHPAIPGRYLSNLGWWGIIKAPHLHKSQRGVATDLLHLLKVQAGPLDVVLLLMMLGGPVVGVPVTLPRGGPLGRRRLGKG